MALKPRRQPGLIVSSFAAGTAMQAGTLVRIDATSQSVVPATATSNVYGLLLQNVIDKPSEYSGTEGTLDTGYVQPAVWDTVYTGDKVAVDRGPAVYVTSKYASGASISYGTKLYVNSSGELTNTDGGGPCVGIAHGAPSSSGYLEFTLDIEQG